MNNIVNFPYNQRAVARIDKNNVVHNHLYHNCPIGSVDCNSIVYNLKNETVGRVDENGIIYNTTLNDTAIGKVNADGFIVKDDLLVGRIEGNNALLCGAAYLLLIDGNR